MPATENGIIMKLFCIYFVQIIHDDERDLSMSEEDDDDDDDDDDDKGSTNKEEGIKE